MNPSSLDLNEDQWGAYLEVIRDAKSRGIQFALGGGFAVASYSNHRLTTKDIDLYVMPDDRERMIEVLQSHNFVDYYDVLAYDRGWIYRAHSGDVIVDVIWSMPNRRAQVDASWLSRGPEVTLHGETVRVLAVEELIWAKLYVLQRDRTDWGDVLNLIHATGGTLDWDHLVSRLGDDAPLLAAVLTIYGWLCPDRVAQLPVLVEILARPASRRGETIPRENLLDTRPWFVHDLQPAEVGS
jgi:hypothetical protein